MYSKKERKEQSDRKRKPRIHQPTPAQPLNQWMEKEPSRNLEMEGQRVRTITPSRNTRTIAALAQRIAKDLRRPRPKGWHNSCPYERAGKEKTGQKETKSQITPNHQGEHRKPRERIPQLKVPEMEFLF